VALLLNSQLTIMECDCFQFSLKYSLENNSTFDTSVLELTNVEICAREEDEVWAKLRAFVMSLLICLL